MATTRVKKSFQLDSEPSLLWPNGSAKLVRVDGFRLSYAGTGLAYTLRPDTTASIEMVKRECTPEERAWREIFSEPRLRPKGLLDLAQLDRNFTRETVCTWVSRNGLLGFHPDPIEEKPSHLVPHCPYNGNLHYDSEPLECIRIAARRASNVLTLWEALKKSYSCQGPESARAIQSVVAINEDIRDSYQYGDEAGYRVRVNGERRSKRPIPKNPRGWRRLANILLAEYIQEHIEGQVRVSLGVQKQNKDRDQEDRNVELPADWNIKPIWHIQTALAAYYVELLMVLRRFRSCKVCGQDISHQKEGSVFCGTSSSCRTKNFHRQKAAEKRSSKPPLH